MGDSSNLQRNSSSRYVIPIQVTYTSTYIHPIRTPRSPLVRRYLKVIFVPISQRHLVQRRHNRVASLEAINEDLYVAKGELERKCTKIVVSVTVQSILNSKDATPNSSNPYEDSAMPSFNLNVRQLDSKRVTRDQEPVGCVKVCGVEVQGCDVVKKIKKMRVALE